MGSTCSRQSTRDRSIGKDRILFGVLLIVVLAFATSSLAGNSVPSAQPVTKKTSPSWIPCGNGPGTPNPAALYCIEMGYKLDVVKEKGGGQHSICIFPDGNTCDAWSFMIGTCGKEYSYCAVNGYDQIIKSDGKHPFSPTYPVCVRPAAKSAQPRLESTGPMSNEVGNPLDLMGITDRLINRRMEIGPLPLTPRILKAPAAAPRADLPHSFDWRDHLGGNWTTPPKDQNACGSCWAHSALSATEAAYNIFLGNPDYDVDLAEEYPNSDCLQNNSCCGGWHYNALELVKTNGVPDEACLPYDSAFYATGACNCFGQATGCPGACPNNDSGICSEKTCTDSCPDESNRLIKLLAYDKTAADTESVKQALIDHGPLSVCFGTTGGTTWKQVDGGPWFLTCDADDPGYVHCVTIVGYDNSNGGFWIVKDNYGTTSGDGTGHWRMGYGECNIQELAYYVTPDANANLPPVADANGPYVAECAGESTTVQLDGTGSYDPNNDTLIYLWSTDCPEASFDDPASATPILTLTTSGIGCGVTCTVTLSVHNDSWPDSISTADVTVSDTVPPVLVGVPEDVTVECDAVPEPASVTATDVCDSGPTVAFSETRTPGNCPSSYSLTRTWTATDACGNSTTATQIITVQDTIPPVISCNSPSTITPPDAPITFTATALDNCDASPSVGITGYDCFAYTKKGKRIDKTESCVVQIAGDQVTIVDSGGVGCNITWTINAVDTCGNVVSEQCGISVVNPGHK